MNAYSDSLRHSSSHPSTQVFTYNTHTHPHTHFYISLCLLIQQYWCVCVYLLTPTIPIFAHVCSLSLSFHLSFSVKVERERKREKSSLNRKSCPHIHIFPVKNLFKLDLMLSIYMQIFKNKFFFQILKMFYFLLYIDNLTFFVRTFTMACRFNLIRRFKILFIQPPVLPNFHVPSPHEIKLLIKKKAFRGKLSFRFSPVCTWRQK